MTEQESQHKNHKILQFATKINDVLQMTWDKPQDAIKTWIYFKAKLDTKNSLQVKTHITNPAMVRIRNYLLNKFWEEKAKDILKEVFILLDNLTKNNTALLSVYIPKQYLKQEILNGETK